MGVSCAAKCTKCGAEFDVSHGGGFSFHLLRCDRCGKEKAVSFEDLGDLHLRYLKGLGMSYSVASAEHDKYVQEHYSEQSTSEVEYHDAIEKTLRKCRCGGRYRFDAPPRCPKCRCPNIEEKGITVCYD